MGGGNLAECYRDGITNSLYGHCNLTFNVPKETSDYSINPVPQSNEHLRNQSCEFSPWWSLLTLEWRESEVDFQIWNGFNNIWRQIKEYSPIGHNIYAINLKGAF